MFIVRTSTLTTVKFVILFCSFQLVQACGTLKDGEPSSTILDEVSQNRKVTVDDNAGPSTTEIGILVRISQARSAFFFFLSPLFHMNASDLWEQNCLLGVFSPTIRWQR